MRARTERRLPSTRSLEASAGGSGWRGAVPVEGEPHEGAPLRRSRAARLALSVVAMTGFRLEHLTALWAVGGLASLAVAHWLIARGDWRLTVPYFVLTLLLYYVGNGLILSTKIPEWAVRRFGEHRAWRRYECLLGLMFLNQGLGVGCMTALPLTADQGIAAMPWLRGVGALLFVVGVVVKAWATWFAGADAFYYKDLFLRRPAVEFVRRGPYRLLGNPMYGVGQLQGYGYALLAGSLLGLVAAGIGQFLIYLFFFAVERPFVRTTYAASESV